MNISEQRNRAIAIATRETDRQGYSPIDYAIDDECRRVLNLPDRPLGTQPYVRWMNLSAIPEKEVMKISDRGVSLIKRWEGFRADAYLCPAKVWTIGYGHTATANRGQCITKERAEELLKEDVARYEDAVRLLVRVPLNQNQFDALVSFTFNLGIGALRQSTLLKKLNKGQYVSAAYELDRWVYAKGKKLPGLVSRRLEEKKLFFEK